MVFHFISWGRCTVKQPSSLKSQHISTDFVPQDNYFHIQCCENLKLRSRFDFFNLKKWTESFELLCLMTSWKDSFSVRSQKIKKKCSNFKNALFAHVLCLKSNSVTNKPTHVSSSVVERNVRAILYSQSLISNLSMWRTSRPIITSSPKLWDV